MPQQKLQPDINAITQRTQRPFEWEDPRCFKINKGEAHVIADNKHQRQSLHGNWRFHWAKNPSERPLDFFKTDFDSSSWQSIKVPGLWQLQGYDTPYYLAASYPPAISTSRFKIPSINHKDNPVGSYLHHFEIKAEDLNKNIFIHFAAVKSAFYLWINGKFVGYSQGSMTPAEFNIRDFVQAGKNQIAVEVYRYSDGTYLEDQDMWFLSGIYRDVYLYIEPETYIHDFFARCHFDEQYENANFQLDVSLSRNTSESLKISYELIDESESEKKILDTQESYLKDSSLISFSNWINKPKQWTAETPNLYTLKVHLSDGDKLIQSKQCKFGFRQVEIKNEKLLVNGKAILLKGVNRHDYDPDHAWTVPEERYHQDLKILKQHNINAIRASHYPNAPRFYELCDEYGMYVMDEADVETHGVRSKNCPGNHPQWEAALVDRGERMVLRDRNHACIIMWSLGNESAAGKNFMSMRKAMLALDDTRPIHYEGDDDKGELSDVLSFMYPALNILDNLGNHRDHVRPFYERIAGKLGFFNAANHYLDVYKGKPIVLCEYAHCMMNSLGNFDEFTTRFEKYDNFCGGFIWDYCDQALRQYENVNGEQQEQWLYGGDFNESKSDKSFCANGIVTADRKLQPAIQEVKKGYQFIKTALIDFSRAEIEVKNDYAFTALDGFILAWEIRSNGDILLNGKLVLNDFPTQSIKNIQLDFSAEHILKEYKESEIILHIRYLSEESCMWHQGNHELAWDEFLISPYQAQTAKPALNINSNSDNDYLSLTSSKGFVRFNKKLGFIDAIDFGDGNLLTSAMHPNFDRARTNNDAALAYVRDIAKVLYPHPWRHAYKNMKLRSLEIKQNPENVEIVSHHSLRFSKDGFHSKTTIHGNGDIDFQYAMTPRLNLIRFGMQLTLNTGLDNFSWYGRGPEENYCDRKMGSAIGLYKRKTSEMIHHYMRPQENGNRCDIRNAELSDNNNQGLFIESTDGQGLSMSVWPWSQDDLDKTEHIHELPVRDFITLNIDHKQQGVGGDIPTLLNLKEQYKIKRNQPLQYQFRISPLS